MSKPWHEKERLQRLYHIENMTMTEICDKLGCAQSTLGYWMDKHDIDRDHYDGPWRNEDLLRELYVSKQKSIPEIAEELDCSHGVVSKWLRRHNIPTRNLNESFVLAGLKDNDICYHSNDDGYMTIDVEHRGERFTLLEHRLLAVAKYGFDAVEDMHVHHKIPIKWLNYEDNIELLTPSEHRKRHSEQ